jgi:hypothetical protein
LTVVHRTHAGTEASDRHRLQSNALECGRLPSISVEELTMRRNSSEETELPQTVILILLCVLAALMLAVGADSALRGGVFAPPRQRQLRRAAEALAAIGQAQRQRTQDIQMPGGGRASIRLGPRYDPRQAIAAFLELERARRDYEALVAEIKTGDDLSAGQQDIAKKIQQVRRRRLDAGERLGEFLILEPDRARVVLCALGWPRLTGGKENASPDQVPAPYPGVPPALRSIGTTRLERIRRDVSRQDEPWLTAAEGLTTEHELAPEQISALQCWLCRRIVSRAFHSGADRDRAATALQRHAALAPTQAEAVLGMRGAQKLLESGPDAFAPLIDLLENRPDVALPLLQVAAGRWGLHRQAFRAATGLGGPEGAAAKKELLALGPFGLDALRQLARAGRTGEEGSEMLGRLRNRWPAGENALEILGGDPRLWRRWYAGAKEVL